MCPPLSPTFTRLARTQAEHSRSRYEGGHMARPYEGARDGPKRPIPFLSRPKRSHQFPRRFLNLSFVAHARKRA